MAKNKPDLKEAEQFLNTLDPGADSRSLFSDYKDGFTFQTFDDVEVGGKKRKDGSLARVFHGTLEEYSAELIRLNSRKAGIFITVNETDGAGRTLANIIKRRTVWIDDDTGANVELPIQPHIVVASSPNKYHKYFLVDNLTEEQRVGIQNALIAKFGSDPGVKDLARVLRLPGFWHNKGEPFQVKILEINNVPHYSAEELMATIGYIPDSAMKSVAKEGEFLPKNNLRAQLSAPTDYEGGEDADYVPISVVDSQKPIAHITLDNCRGYLPEPGNYGRGDWLDVLHAFHFQFSGSKEALEIIIDWSSQCSGFQGLEDVTYNWNLASRGNGKKKITFAYLIKLYNKKHGLRKAASDASSTSEAANIVSKSEKYLDLVRDTAPKLWKLADGNVALEKDFRTILIDIYTFLRPGFSLTIPEAIKAMKTKQKHEKNKPEAILTADFDRTPFWAKGFVWVAENENFYHIDNRTILTSTGFAGTYNSELPDFDGKPINAASYLRDNNLIPKVARSMYYPSMPAIFDYSGVRHVNTYNNKYRAPIPKLPCKVDGAAEAVAAFERHLSLIFGGLGREAQIFCNFLAAATCDPPIKVRWAPLIIGSYGDGKSLIFNLISNAIGSSNTLNLNTALLSSTVESGKSGWAEGHSFGFIEELKLQGHNRFDVVNALKQYLSNDTIPIRNLYKESRDVPNTVNYMAVSNYLDCIPLENGERRWFPWKSLLDLTKLEPGYFVVLTDAIRDFTGEIVFWLRNVPLHPDFDPNGHAPMTSTKKQIQHLSKDDMVDYVIDILEETENVLICETALCFGPLFSRLQLEMPGMLKDNEWYKLQKVLLTLGYSKLSRVALLGEKHSLWAKSPVGDDEKEQTAWAKAVLDARITNANETGLSVI
jgi:hypothetical protein